MTILYFTKEITSGLLKGIRINETMSFVSEQEAGKFVTACKGGIKSKQGNWRIVDASFQKYWRY